MYLDELSIIFCNYHCNFLAMAITPYQAVGVNAAISYLESIGVEINGYILMTSHPETGRTLDESYFRTGNHKIKCIDFEYSFKDRNIIKQIKSRINQFIICRNKSKGIPFYFVWTEILNNILSVIKENAPLQDLVFIKIDDGAASYLSPYECRCN